MADPNLALNAKQYADNGGIQLLSRLGHGNDGIVFESNRQTAVKVLERERNYRHELQCYQRLKAKGITSLVGFSVPALLG